VECCYAECRGVKYNASGRDSGYTYLGSLGITAANIRQTCLMLQRLSHQRQAKRLSLLLAFWQSNIVIKNMAKLFSKYSSFDTILQLKSFSFIFIALLTSQIC
jgi:hypothetical protein